MTGVVNHTTQPAQPLCCIFSNAADHPTLRQWGMTEQPPHRPTNIRRWRQKSGLSLDQLAEKAKVDKGNLSKMERGLLPYNQEVMERVAEALGVTVGDLIEREPDHAPALWTTLRRASPEQQRLIERMAAAVISGDN